MEFMTKCLWLLVFNKNSPIFLTIYYYHYYHFIIIIIIIIIIIVVVGFVAFGFAIAQVGCSFIDTES